MHQDSTRNKLEVKMYCSKHPKEELNFSPDSNVGANSAYEINVRILVHPCIQCENKFNNIKNSVRTLLTVSGDLTDDN